VHLQKISKKQQQQQQQQHQSDPQLYLPVISYFVEAHRLRIS